MGRGKFAFYKEYREVEADKGTTLVQYTKIAVPYVFILLLMWLLLRDDASNSAKVGDVGNVGGSITIYNSDGKHVPKGHVNVTKYNREREAEFLTYLALLEKYNENIKLMLVSLNDRLVTLSDEATSYTDLIEKDLTHTHVTFWYKQCGDGYIALNGGRINYNDVKESLGSTIYPDLTELLSNKDIIPCIYIGK